MTEKTFDDTVFASHPTGSRYICNPPVEGTDNDTVLLVNGFYDWEAMLLQEGWEKPFADYPDLGQYFSSFRKGEDNYIVTEDVGFYEDYVKATEAARRLNLLDKDDRIALFDAIFSARDDIADSFMLRKQALEVANIPWHRLDLNF